MPPFYLFHLNQDEIGLAWPLARTAHPQLQLDGWERLFVDLKSRGGGVLALAAPDDVLHGIASYEPVETQRRGRVLSVDTLVTFELNARAPVEQLLRQGLDRLARQLSCTAVLVSMGKRRHLVNRRIGS